MAWKLRALAGHGVLTASLDDYLILWFFPSHQQPGTLAFCVSQTRSAPVETILCRGHQGHAESGENEDDEERSDGDEPSQGPGVSAIQVSPCASSALILTCFAADATSSTHPRPMYIEPARAPYLFPSRALLFPSHEPLPPSLRSWPVGSNRDSRRTVQQAYPSSQVSLGLQRVLQSL